MSKKKQRARTGSPCMVLFELRSGFSRILMESDQPPPFTRGHDLIEVIVSIVILDPLRVDDVWTVFKAAFNDDIWFRPHRRHRPPPPQGQAYFMEVTVIKERFEPLKDIIANGAWSRTVFLLLLLLHSVSLAHAWELKGIVKKSKLKPMPDDDDVAKGNEASRDVTMTLNQIIEEKNRVIEKKNRIIDEKDRIIAEQARIIAAQAARITSLEARLDALEHEFAAFRAMHTALQHDLEASRAENITLKRELEAERKKKQ